VEPAAEADQRGGGPEDIPGPVQQAAPAAQRPGSGQMPDRLLHQGAQPGLATVVGAFGGGALISGAPVAGRRVPVRPSLGQPSKPSVDQGGDLGIIQDLVDPPKGSAARARGSCQASHRPTTAGHHGWPTPPRPGRCGCGAWRRRAPSGWPRIGADAPGWPAPRPRPPRRWRPSRQGVGPGRPGWSRRPRRVGNPDHPPCPPIRQPVQQHRADRVQPDLQRQRPGAAPAGWPGWEQVGQATKQARPRPRRATTNAGSMTTGPDLQAGVRNLAYGLVPSCTAHRGITGTLNDVPGLAAHRDRRRPDDGRSSGSGLALDGASRQIGSTQASGGCDAGHDHAGRHPGSDLRKEAALCLPRGADAGASTTGTTRSCSRSLGFPGPPRPRSAIRDRRSGFVMGR
jgi:hypothetical protein